MGGNCLFFCYAFELIDVFPFSSHTQYEMIGNSVMEFIHPDDHKELAKQFVVQVPGRVSIAGMGVPSKKDTDPKSMTVNYFDDSGEWWVGLHEICKPYSVNSVQWCQRVIQMSRLITASLTICVACLSIRSKWNFGWRVKIPCLSQIYTMTTLHRVWWIEYCTPVPKKCTQEDLAAFKNIMMKPDFRSCMRWDIIPGKCCTIQGSSS